ncbi:hypothetical protein MPLB_1870081 [Mesorhizobium sp. ORS 3324]|nr:hypothetical protein MPLB_1870081 [Mesorhizobium sp. ORS 3324]
MLSEFVRGAAGRDDRHRRSSGSGKIAKLLQRLQCRNVAAYAWVDLALTASFRQIGIMMQQKILFRRTARENTALADPALPQERIIGAAKLPAHEPSP